MNHLFVLNLLDKLGYQTTTPRDGFARDAVLRYQLESGLTSDGVIGPITRASVIADSELKMVSGFIGFWGSLALIVHHEGHAGRPYWPGGASGVTLDPGFDLGWQTSKSLREHYYFLGPEGLHALERCIGIRGQEAHHLLRSDPHLLTIRINRDRAAKILPYIASQYWKYATNVCLSLSDARTPRGVQSALLSLCYNCGPDDLLEFSKDVMNRRWDRVGHRLSGIPKLPERRAHEAALVFSRR